MNFNARIDIQLTEAAAAVARPPSFQVPPQIQSWLLSVQMPDLVTLPPCTQPLVVVFREWVLSSEELTLKIVLGLPNEPTKLKAI